MREGRTKDTYAEIVSNTITWTTTHNRITVQCNPHYLKPDANTEEMDTIGYKTQKTKPQLIPVKCLSVMEERTNLRRKEKIPCKFRYGYFVAINQIVMSTVHIL